MGDTLCAARKPYSCAACLPYFVMCTYIHGYIMLYALFISLIVTVFFISIDDMNDSGNDDIDLGAIIGGSVAGFIFLIIIIAIAVVLILIYQKRQGI